MKKVAMTISIVLMLGLFAGMALAADKKLTAQISSVVESVTKTGAPYVRAIMLQEKSLDGVSYESGIPLMFFGDLYDAGKQLKAGDTVTVIARERNYNGNPSLTVLKLVQ